MKKWTFTNLLEEKGWTSQREIFTDENGLICDKPEEGGTVTSAEHVSGYTIPGFFNAHSHAFQYAMAGLAEKMGGSSNDSFWTWRETMYALANRLNPAEIEAVAAMAYSEMLRQGYTHVTEFHYLHHAVDGHYYQNIAEISLRLISAAKTAGIGITLIPVLYQKGGFGKSPDPLQNRFINTHESYFQLREEIQSRISGTTARLGTGIHSIRAVDRSAFQHLLENANYGIIHLHIAEQLKEVNDCIDHHGKRPVRWLMDNFPVDDRFNLIHATHLDSGEISDLASSGARVVLCPTTEANLGDGIFPLIPYIKKGGSWTIGSDSHICLSPLEELRWLDYSHRLQSHQRITYRHNHSGIEPDLYAYSQAVSQGSQASGFSSQGFFAPGNPLSAIVLSDDHAILGVRKTEDLLSTLIYHGDPSFFSGVLSSGNWIIKSNWHIQEEKIRREFKKCMDAVSARL